MTLNINDGYGAELHEQKPCEFCCKDSSLLCMAQSDSVYPRHRTGIDAYISGKALIIEAMRYAQEEIDIRYCPMCGRKL